MMRRAATCLLFVCLWAPSSFALAQTVENTPRLCQNEIDDDEDGLVDCADDGCRQLIFCVNYQPPEEGEEACQNEADDDNDGAVDCADDGCADVCGRITVPTDGQPGTRGIYQPRVIETGPEVGYLEHEDPRDYPFNYAERPMTYLEGMLVPQLGLSFQNLTLGGLGGSDVLTELAMGVSYGVLDFLEVHAVPLAFRLSPGDAEYGSPALGTTLRFFSEEVIEMGLYANMVLPLTTLGGGGTFSPLPTSTLTSRARLTSVVQLDAALLLRLRFAELVRIDFTLPVVSVIFLDDPLTGELDPLANLTFDLKLGFSILDYAYVGVYTGVLLPGRDYDTPIMPFGFFAGGVIPGPSRRGPLMDIGVRFGWPLFANLNPPSGADPVNADAWQLTFDVRVFTFLLP